MDWRHTSKAAVLQQAMEEASAALQEARRRYERAMATANDGGGDTDGLLILRLESQEYAQALTHSTTATMEWLRYIDTVLRSEGNTAEAERGK